MADSREIIASGLAGIGIATSTNIATGLPVGENVTNWRWAALGLGLISAACFVVGIVQYDKRDRVHAVLKGRGSTDTSLLRPDVLAGFLPMLLGAFLLLATIACLIAEHVLSNA